MKNCKCGTPITDGLAEDTGGICTDCALIELRRLRAIVDRLPKTADGVTPFWFQEYPFSTVWVRNGMDDAWVEGRITGYLNPCGGCPGLFVLHFGDDVHDEPYATGDCYSTLAEAEAARSKT